MNIDDCFYLMGDEEAGVGAHCRTCDRLGLPAVYYTYPQDTTYADKDVVVVTTITEFLAQMDIHQKTHS